MFKQTTCLSFKKYGETLSSLPDDIIICEKKTSITLLEKSITKLFYAEFDIHIKLQSGVVLIVVSNDSNFNSIESFILNSKIKLNKGVFYNFIPISDNCNVDLYGNSLFF